MHIVYVQEAVLEMFCEWDKENLCIIIYNIEKESFGNIEKEK